MAFDKEKFAANLRAHRAITRLSQQEVAEKAGVSYAALRSWENGDVVIGSDSLVLLADFYCVDTDSLIGRTVSA